jgi:hypothetical protein
VSLFSLADEKNWSPWAVQLSIAIFSMSNENSNLRRKVGNDIFSEHDQKRIRKWVSVETGLTGDFR